MKFLLVIILAILAFGVNSQVVNATDEADMYRINDEYPSRYSVVIYNGKETGFLSTLESIFTETKHQQQERELEQIIQFFEDNPYYEIPIIMADVDTSDFSNSMEEFGVEQVPWIVILDENNDEVYSSEPVPEADEEILVAMNIFTSTIMNPPSDDDEVDFDIDYAELFGEDFEIPDFDNIDFSLADSSDSTSQCSLPPPTNPSEATPPTPIEEAPVFEDTPIATKLTTPSTEVFDPLPPTPSTPTPATKPAPAPTPTPTPTRAQSPPPPTSPKGPSLQPPVAQRQSTAPSNGQRASRVGTPTPRPATYKIGRQPRYYSL